ncbi:MAG: glycosyl transferase family 9 [Candidatus Solibacter sp.]|nr:glycosyl transferase family 9 [Candidatus Solibacter sp.]
MVYLIGTLGDTIIAIPALRAIREQWPDSSLLLLYNSDEDGRVTARDVLDGTGLVDEFLPYNSKRYLTESFRILRFLRRRKIDEVIYLAPSLRPHRAVLRDLWFFRLSGARRLAGFGPLEKTRRHEGEARLHRLQLSGIPIGEQARAIPLLQPTAQALNTVSTWLGACRAESRRPMIAIGPGSQMASKHWPIERFAELGRRLLANFPVDLVIVGGTAERQAGEVLKSGWGAGLNAAGQFSVPETAALLSQVDLLVTLDTGPMHLAAAVGTPCIALFSGIEVPGKWDPIGSGHIVIRKDVECAGCRLTVCPRADHPCMMLITVDDVWQAIQAKSAEWKGVCTV